MKIFSRKNKYIHHSVDPDEIFLDVKNLPNFDSQQFEGRIEKPIKKTTLKNLGIISFVVLSFFVFRLSSFQLVEGKSYLEQSKNNSLTEDPIFADRGIIFDRYQNKLAWNEQKTETDAFGERAYIQAPGFAHLLGYVNYPKKDKKGFYWRPYFIGSDGTEKVFNTELSGVNGSRLIEHTVSGDVTSENIVNPPVQGKSVVLSIDRDIQAQLFTSLKNGVEQYGYQGGGAAMMDIHTGEILALTSFPEYDSNILSTGKDTALINQYFKDSRKPFLNRVIGGLYSPGSIIKPFIAMGALTEGVITPEKKILSQGSIGIPNPYNPGLKSVFKDYRANNGWVDLRKALAVSSNIYFYNVGGGYQDQKGIGISNIEKYVRMFHIGEKTSIELTNEQEGSIPSVLWKEKNFPNDPWRIGDTYNTAIGQYGFQVTPIQMLRAVASIATKGVVPNPTIIKKESTETLAQETLPFKEEYFTVLQEGMRGTITSPEGTVTSLNNLPFTVAAKTGTAEVGAQNEYINSWLIGFFPYESPKYAFVATLDRGPSYQTPHSPVQKVTFNFFSWLALYKQQYTK